MIKRKTITQSAESHPDFIKVAINSKESRDCQIVYKNYCWKKLKETAPWMCQVIFTFIQKGHTGAVTQIIVVNEFYEKYTGEMEGGSKKAAWLFSAGSDGVIRKYNLFTYQCEFSSWHHNDVINQLEIIKVNEKAYIFSLSNDGYICSITIDGELSQDFGKN